MADKDMPLPFSTAIMAHLALDAASVLLLLTSLSMGTPVTLTVCRCTLKRRRIGLRRTLPTYPITIRIVCLGPVVPLFAEAIVPTFLSGSARQTILRKPHTPRTYQAGEQ